MPICSWNYEADDSSRHLIGPTAQDFYAAFSLGDSDKAIASIDADGVALAAIQGLYNLVQEKVGEIAQLRAEKDIQIAALKAEKDAHTQQIAAQQQQIAAQQQRIADLEARLAAVETMITSLAAGKKF